MARITKLPYRYSIRHFVNTVFVTKKTKMSFQSFWKLNMKNNFQILKYVDKHLATTHLQCNACMCRCMALCTCTLYSIAPKDSALYCILVSLYWHWNTFAWHCVSVWSLFTVQSLIKGVTTATSSQPRYIRNKPCDVTYDVTRLISSIVVFAF